MITGIQRQFGYDSLNRLTVAQDIYSNLAVPSGSNGQTTSTTTSTSGAGGSPGASGAVPWSTNPDDSNLLQSIDLSGSAWNGSASIALNASAAPDGTNSAVQITAPSGSNDAYWSGAARNPSGLQGETVTGSVWMRSISGNQNVNIYITTNFPGGYGVPGFRQVQLTSTWQQFSVSATLQAPNLTGVELQIGGGGSVSNGQSFLVWDPMLEDEGMTGGTVTNFTTYSQRFSGTSWNVTQGNAADNTVLAPDGTTTAATITANSTATDNCVIDAVTNVAPFSGVPVTGSVWLKVPNGSQQVLLTMYEASSGSPGGSLGAQWITLTTSWQRFQITGTTVSALNYLAFQVGGASSFTNGQVIQIWGAQMELASTAGPYVATGGLPATRWTSLTNLVTYSQRVSGPSWELGAVNASDNAVAAPDGSMTGAQITGTSSDSVMAATAPNAGLYDARDCHGLALFESAQWFRLNYYFPLLD